MVLVSKKIVMLNLVCTGLYARWVAKQDWSKVDLMLEDFKLARNSFGNEMAKIAIKTKNPADWWDSYGSEHPELQHFAKRILSLTTNSVGCVDNRNAFDKVKFVSFTCKHIYLAIYLFGFYVFRYTRREEIV